MGDPVSGDFRHVSSIPSLVGVPLLDEFCRAPFKDV